MATRTPSHSLATLPGISATPEATGHPSPSPTTENSLVGFSRRPENFSLSRFSAPWRPPAPTASASTTVVSDVVPPLAAAPPGPVSAPLSSGPYAVGVGVSIIPTSSATPAVLASPSDADSSVSSLLHLALSATLSSVSVLPSQYSPPAPTFFYCPGGPLSPPPPLPLSVDTIVAVASVVSLAAPVVTCFAPLPSLDIPPASLPPPLPSLRLFRPLGSCIRLRCPLRLLPRPRPPILSVTTKISAIGQAGVSHAGQLQAGLRHTGSSLSGPSSWWGTASTVPCSYTAANSSTPCTVGRRCGTQTPWQTGPW